MAAPIPTDEMLPTTRPPVRSLAALAAAPAPIKTPTEVLTLLALSSYMHLLEYYPPGVTHASFPDEACSVVVAAFVDWG